MADDFEKAAVDFETIAHELERAGAHARVVAAHYRDKNIPRAGAHSIATLGHMKSAEEIFNARAQFSASKALLEGD